MNGVILEEVQSYKHLGDKISNNLSWNEHIEDMVTNAGKCIDVLNALKYKLDRCTLEKLYVAFIRSKLEYASIVWDNCPKHLSDLIESLQYRAGKIVSGAIHRTSHELLYTELGWEHLEEHRKKQRLRVLYKILHGSAPIYLQQFITVQQGERNHYMLRNKNNIPQFRARTSTFLESFYSKNYQ